MLRLYAGAARMSILDQLQYRTANYLYMIGMIAEPVIYLVVWSTVAESQGGSVGGYSAGALAAYYIVWTLVRNMNIVLTPYAWEWRIKDGQLSSELLKPIHPIHRDLGGFAGWKIVTILYWLPIAAILVWLFPPTFSTDTFSVVAFVVALWGGFLVRFMLLWALGLVTFWTTRVGAIFDVFFTVELLASGRLVPLSLMPPWAQTAADWLPFQWAFQFPIETLIGRLSRAEILFGLGMQALWTLVGVGILVVVWPRAVKRYSAVGG